MEVVTAEMLAMARVAGACDSIENYREGQALSEVLADDLAWFESTFPAEARAIAVRMTKTAGGAGAAPLAIFGYGGGRGDGSGSGYGSGHGSGYGDGYGYGYGYGSGHGSGRGYGDGYGDGRGYGDGYGDGYGYGGGA